MAGELSSLFSKRDKAASFFFVLALKLYCWHTTARSFIWSHTFTVLTWIEASIDISFRCLTLNVQAQTEHSFNHTPNENKRSVLFKAGIKLNAAVFGDCDFNFLFNRFVVYFSLLECVCWMEAAIQFQETSMKLLTAPFIHASICRHRQIGINWFHNRNIRAAVAAATVWLLDSNVFMLACCASTRAMAFFLICLFIYVILVRIHHPKCSLNGIISSKIVSFHRFIYIVCVCTILVTSLWWGFV